MTETYSIAGYCRISVDLEQDRDNTSIENQKAIIQNYVEENFPGSTLTMFEDRDRSGYTFEQREGYQEMRRGLINHKFDILLIKDLSRFSRRNSRGLVELEDLRDYGVRIISIGDGVDYPNADDWLKIRLLFLINEIPVTDASQKVKAVVTQRQKAGEWICAAPYGYRITPKKEFEIIPTEAEVIRKIYQLYMEGMGYNRIARYLTDNAIPTPRKSEQMRREEEGRECNRQVKSTWSIATIQGILENDFYIGTLRQGKTTRAKINGKDVKRDVSEQYVIENHHQPIIDYRTFATVRELKASRSTNHYRGQKKYDNVYSGFLRCGDCGSPMFAMSRPDIADAYRCGAYHRNGRKACSSHHIRVQTLDELLKAYVRLVRDNSAGMIEELNRELEKEDERVGQTEVSAADLEKALAKLREELLRAERQRIRNINREPEHEQRINEMYDKIEEELQHNIDGLENQLALTLDKRNTIIRVNRIAKTALEIFDQILEKEKLDKDDLLLLVDRILVFEDHVEIHLKADIDSLLSTGTIPPEALESEQTVNFNDGMENIAQITVNQPVYQRADKVFHANVVSDGDPLEIYTEKDGGVVFRKYSPMGELADFAGQICESLHRTTGRPVAVCDRDAVIAVSGLGRRELMEKRISGDLERLMESRGLFAERGDCTVPVAEGEERWCLAVAAPILSQGDVLGCVTFLQPRGGEHAGVTEEKLADAVSNFLGKQLES